MEAVLGYSYVEPASLGKRHLPTSRLNPILKDAI